MVIQMNEIKPLNVQFVKDYIDFLRGDMSKIGGLLNYAFYLLIKKKDELSLNFAYSIIINYTLKFKDYGPLIEFSIIFGYSPILNIIYNKIGISTNKEIENFIANYYIENNKYNDKILTSGQKIIYRMIETNNDYSIIAPTSFGKTDLMLESSLKSKGDCIIIVPLTALLTQVKQDLSILAKKEKINVKLITHHEIKRSNNYKNIYILTQERCFELVKKNKFENITDLFIDEAHKLLGKGERSYKLSQIIFLLKIKFNCCIKYYSPVLYDPSSVQIKGVHKKELQLVNGIMQIREALQHIADATRMVQIKPRTLEVTLATLPSFGCHWLLPRLARFQARHPQIAVRLLTSLAVVNLQQEGIDLAIRMGQGDWEGMESRHLFADEQLVVAAPGYRGGNLPTTPQAIAASDIIFSMESWNAWCSQAGLEKPIVPSGLRLNDSNLVLEAVRLGAGVALERRSLVAGAIARGELVQLTAVTVPYPWHYWLTVSPQSENRPEVARFIAWLEEEIALWRQQISA